jgi:hypothetical protein
MDEMSNENTLLTKKFTQSQQLLEKQKEFSLALENKQKLMETQLCTTQTKLDEMITKEKQSVQNFRAKEIRLNRALEENEKLKIQLQEEKNCNKTQTVEKKELENTLKELKKLEKQKNDLLMAFKKQMKLIEILKKQKIHLEASKMLQFTEEEFTKTLELN